MFTIMFTIMFTLLYCYIYIYCLQDAESGMSLRGAKRRGNPDDNNASGTSIYTGLLRSARNDDGAGAR